MYIAIVVLIAVVCVLLVVAVLAQNAKGGGASQVIGSASSQLIGVQRTSDLLEKITWGLAISLFVLCLTAKAVIDTGEEGDAGINSVNVERAREAGGGAPQQAPPVQQQPAPAGGNQ